jgi:hypothetical protein
VKISKNTIFLFDFWFSIGLFIFILIFIIIISYIIDFTDYLYLNPLFILIGYNFIKSIVGGILLFNAQIKNEIILTKNIIFSFGNILYLILHICILFFYPFRLYDPDINYNIIFLGLSFSTFQIYIFTIIKIFVNTFGIPMWYIYLLSESKTKNYKRQLFDIFTRMFILFMNWMLIIGLTVD